MSVVAAAVRVVAPVAVTLVLAACAGGTDLETPAAAGTAVDRPAAAAAPDPQAEAGRRLAVDRNCVSCHSADGTDGVGPTWLGLDGSVERLTDGSTVVVDRDYLVRAIEQPAAEVVDGFVVVPMPAIEMSDDEVDAIVAYIESLAS